MIYKKEIVKMNEKVGKRVELLIFDKGFSSIRKFAEYLKENNYECYVTEDTIYNLIKGKGFQNNTLVCISKGLGVPIDCLTAENMPLVDNYLFNEVASVKKEMESDIKLFEERGINNLQTVRRLYDIDKRVYPNQIGELYNRYGFEITTLAEMSIYFPLCQLRDVIEVIFRIRGEVENYESYIFGQYAWLYGTIPDIPAKKFADCQAIKLRLSNKQNLNGDEEKLLKCMTEYEESELWKEGYLQYKSIINRAYELYKNGIINDIFKARIPELY